MTEATAEATLALDDNGLLPQFAAAIANAAANTTSEVRVHGNDDVPVNAKSLMSLLVLAPAPGATLRVTVRSEDPAEAQRIAERVRAAFETAQRGD